MTQTPVLIESPEQAAQTARRSHTLTWLFALAAVAGLCYGILSTRGWAFRIEFLLNIFQGWPRPRTMDWMESFAQRERAIQSLLPGINALQWIAGLIAIGLLARTLSADIPFVVPGQSQRKGVRDWMSIWVEPRLIVRGLIALFFSLWVIGAGELVAGPAMVNTELKRFVFGGVRLAILQASNEYPILRQPLLVHWLLCVALISLMFLAWSSDGLFTTHPFDFIRGLKPLFQGILAGTSFAVLSFPFTSYGGMFLTEYIRAQGISPAARPTNFKLIYGNVLLSIVCALAFCFVILGFSKLKHRFRFAFLGFAGVLVIAAGQAFFYRYTLIDRLDFGKTLATAAGVRPAHETRRIAVLTGSQPRCPSNRIVWATAAGLDGSRESRENVEQFIRKRNYRTALARESFVHLFDVAALNFDREEGLRLCLEFQTRHSLLTPGQLRRMIPQPLQLAREMLSDMPLTPANRQMLEQLCNEREFAVKEAQTMLTRIADAWLRFGDKERAKRYYERVRSLMSTRPAGSEPVPMGRGGFEARPYEEQLREPAGMEGAVRGRILIAGKPAKDTLVGIVYTPRWLELMQPTANAFSLRNICLGTRTDAEGNFELKHIGKGQYYLVIAFNPDYVIPVSEVEITNQPGVITIPEQPVRDLGEIRVRPVTPRRPAEERSA